MGFQIDLARLSDNRLLAYLLPTISLILPGLTLIIMKDFDFFVKSPLSKLMLLSVILSLSIYLICMFVFLFVYAPKMNSYQFHIIVGIMTLLITYVVILVELSFVYFTGNGPITDYLQFLFWTFIAALIMSLFMRREVKVKNKQKKKKQAE